MRNVLLAPLAVVVLLGCASAPRSRPDQRDLEARADATLTAMRDADPSLREVLDEAAAYVVFPRITSGGFIAGAQGGVGVVYRHDVPIGYATISGGSIGFQAGGQRYAELMIFRTAEAFERMRGGDFDLSAGLTATALQEGSARQARFEDGVAVIISDESGLMAGASVGGETVTFTAK